MSKLAIVAYTLTLLATVALILLMVAGSSPDALSQLTLFDVHVEDVKLSSQLASSQFLRALQEISGTDLTGDIKARQLGLAKSYAIYIYTICLRPFDGRTTCSDFEVGWWFNPKKELRLGERGFSIDFSNDYESAVDFYKSTSYYLGIAIILALSANVLSFVFGALARKFPKIRLLPASMSLLAAILLATQASLAFRVTRRMVRALESGLDTGITASLGPMIYLLFATMTVSILATILHLSSSGWRNHGGSVKRPRYPQFAGPPEDPAAGQNSGYDNKMSLKQMMPWKNHKYEKVDRQKGGERPISMEPLRPQDEASLLRPGVDERY